MFVLKLVIGGVIENVMFLFVFLVYSCINGVKEEEMVWKVIVINWWNIVYDWVLMRGVWEC